MARAPLASAFILSLILPGQVYAAPPNREPFSFTATDDRLCRFPLAVTVSGEGQHHVQQREGQPSREFFTGPARIDLTNLANDDMVRLNTPGPAFFELDAGIGRLRGAVVGIYGPGIPLLAMRGQTVFKLADFVIVRDTGKDAVVDPCRLLDPGVSPAITRATPAPWDPPADVLGGIQLAGLLPVFFGYQRHLHAHLDVIVNGTPLTVPAGIGLVEPVIDLDGKIVSALHADAPLHTHTADGIVHVEADRPPLELTLGQFFDIWQVRLSRECLGSYCEAADSTLRVYVNGELRLGDPRTLVIESFDEIALVFGPPGVPAEIPSTFDFPPDLS